MVAVDYPIMTQRELFLAASVPLKESPMLTQLTRNWWVVILRGVVAILFGLVGLLLPVATIGALVLAFGVYAIVDGVFAVIGAFTNRAGHDRWWVLLLEGLLGIGAGVIVLMQPGLATLVLLTLIAVWAI